MSSRLSKMRLPEKLKCSQCKSSLSHSLFTINQLQAAQRTLDRTGKALGASCKICTSGPPTELTCSNCDILLPLTHFSKNSRRNRDEARCKTCMDVESISKPLSERVIEEKIRYERLTEDKLYDDDEDDDDSDNDKDSINGDGDDSLDGDFEVEHSPYIFEESDDTGSSDAGGVSLVETERNLDNKSYASKTGITESIYSHQYLSRTKSQTLHDSDDESDSDIGYKRPVPRKIPPKENSTTQTLLEKSYEPVFKPQNAIAAPGGWSEKQNLELSRQDLYSIDENWLMDSMPQESHVEESYKSEQCSNTPQNYTAYDQDEEVDIDDWD